MEWIVVTSPESFAGEAAAIGRLFGAGLDRLHLRKPHSPADECRRLLDALPADCLGRIVLHDHFVLCREYGLGGVHLNGRNGTPPAGHCGTLSRSCHSLEELPPALAACDYVFLSPIFDSISKVGYAAAFEPRALDAAAARGLINRRVVALGGVTASRIGRLRAWGFGGAALLGDIWGRQHTSGYTAYLAEIERAIHHKE